MFKTVLAFSLLATLMWVDTLAGEQFSMSDADRAMYKEMLENNPAEIYVEEGGESFETLLGGEAALARFLGVSENQLPAYIAGFPRYIKKLGNVVGLDQVIQAMQVEQGKEKTKLDSEKMFSMLAYVKSLANGEAINIDVNADTYMQASYALGKKTYMTARGGRGLACHTCHSPEIVGQILRTQPLPDLGEVSVAGTWPAYRMTKASLRTPQKRFQGCMKQALLEPIPLGSKEMVALEVYIATLAKDKNKTIAVPGLKR